MTRKAAFVYEDAMSRHTLSETHPMRPVRLRYTYELAYAFGLFDPGHSTLTPSRPATVEEVATFHTPEYISAVEMLRGPDHIEIRLTSLPAYVLWPLAFIYRSAATAAS